MQAVAAKQNLKQEGEKINYERWKEIFCGTWVKIEGGIWKRRGQIDPLIFFQNVYDNS